MNKTNKGIENLKPISSVEEAREKGRKGGLASVESFRKRKKLKEELSLMLEVVMSNGKTVQENWVSALSKKLLEGDIQTSIFVRDTIGEKPMDKVEFSGNISKVADDIGDFINADRDSNKHD